MKTSIAVLITIIVCMSISTVMHFVLLNKNEDVITYDNSQIVTLINTSDSLGKDALILRESLRSTSNGTWDRQLITQDLELIFKKREVISLKIDSIMSTRKKL